MKVGVVGHGFVGKSIESILHSNVDVLISDPKADKGVSVVSLEEMVMEDLDAIFVCVPSPKDRNGDCDTSIVSYVLHNIFRYIDDYYCDTLIVIKSTVPPDFFEDINFDKYKVVYNPEFLTEANYKMDAVNPRMVVVGGKKEDAELLSRIYSEHTEMKKCEHFHTDFKGASLVKYGINTFLATKVVFMNHMYDILKESGSEATYEALQMMITADDRIGKSHTSVPCNGEFGYGGACFPKDVEAFINYCEKTNVEFNLLKTAHEDNKKFKKKK